jgi:hypothetical protein
LAAIRQIEAKYVFILRNMTSPRAQNSAGKSEPQPWLPKKLCFSRARTNRPDGPPIAEYLAPEVENEFQFGLWAKQRGEKS